MKCFVALTNIYFRMFGKQLVFLDWTPLQLIWYFLFLTKKLEDTCPLCATTDAPVLDFWWWCQPWISKPGSIPCFHTLLPSCNVFHRFISGMATSWPPAWQLVVFSAGFSRGRMLGFKLEISRTVTRCAMNSATATCHWYPFCHSHSKLFIFTLHLLCKYQ